MTTGKLKDCSACRHNNSCKWLEQAEALKAAFEQQYPADKGNPTLPLLPTNLALNCEDYETPMDVIKMAKQTQEVTN